eukprot:TRINITY_DN4220_c0_g1_i1.p1 TRINITY_DN4220_c0_g1~~TRINITY_DN4220_c0_g1_i1.p1  ORF type:complete len:276 (-),score=38.50 TRINITY_DN4220_c0_g1_i1:118-945(-)
MHALEKEVRALEQPPPPQYVEPESDPLCPLDGCTVRLKSGEADRSRVLDHVADSLVDLVTEHNIPLSSAFDVFRHLLESMGAHVAGELDSYKSTLRFLFARSEAEWFRLARVLADAEFIAVGIDETSTHWSESFLVLNVLYATDESAEIQQEFGALVELMGGKSAKILADEVAAFATRVRRYQDLLGIDGSRQFFLYRLEELIADNTSTNTGELGGIIPHLRALQQQEFDEAKAVGRVGGETSYTPVDLVNCHVHLSNLIGVRIFVIFVSIPVFN